MSAAEVEDWPDAEVIDAQAAFALSEGIGLAAADYQLTPVTITRGADGKKRCKFHESWGEDSAWSSDPDQVKAWWTDHPDTSFAYRTGQAGGVDVVDLDVADGKDGVTWWAEQGHPVTAMIVDTPSGGQHLVGPACGLPTAAGKFAPGVDTRGDGGLVIAPGGYVVGEPGSYRRRGPLVPVADLEPFPPDLVAAIRAAQPDRSSYPTDGAVTDKDREWVEGVAERALAKVSGMPLHTGGSEFRDAQMGAAMILGRMADAGLCTPEGARKAIVEATLAVWPDGLSADDVRNIDSGLADGPRKERWRVREDQAAAAEGPEGDERPAAEEDAFVLPAEVWERTPVLRHIRQAALARQVSPDVVLHGALATVASLLHHGSRVDTGKRPSILAHFVAAIGPSGSGKSEGLEVATELLADWTADRLAIVGRGPDHQSGYYTGPLGSGEGIVEALMGSVEEPKLDHHGQPIVSRTGVPVTTTVRRQVRHNALLSSDEGRALLSLDARKGSTLMSTLCQLWSGSLVGSTNADKDRNRQLAAGSYAVSVLLGFQPDTADGLFADEAGGAPQRFVFVAASHPGITEDDEPWPGGLAPDVPVKPLSVTLPAEMRREVRAHQARRARGQSDEGPLDGHRMLITCRTAVLLALLHSEQEVTPAHWELAHLLVAASSRLRDHLAGHVQRKAAEVTRRREESTVRAQVTAAAKVAEADRARRAADRVVAAVERAEGKELTYGRARHALRRERDVADAAISLALADGRLVAEDRDSTGGGGPSRFTVLRLPQEGDGE